MRRHGPHDFWHHFFGFGAVPGGADIAPQHASDDGFDRCLHRTAIDFDLRNAGCHVDQKPIAAQHVLATGRHHPAERGDRNWDRALRRMGIAGDLREAAHGRSPIRNRSVRQGLDRERKP